MKKAAVRLLFSMKRTCGAWKMKYGFAIWSLAVSRRKPVVRVTSYERKRVLHGSEAAASYLHGKYFINKQGLYVNRQPPGCFFQWSAPAVHEKMKYGFAIWSLAASRRKPWFFKVFGVTFFVGCPCISARLLYSEPSVLLRLRTPHPLKILQIKLARNPRFC